MNTFLAIFNAFPAILQTVQAVEVAIPMSNAGQQKMNLVLAAASTAWEIGAIGEQTNKTNVLAAVQAMTNVAVAGLSTAGVFGTQPSTAAVAAPVSPAATAPVLPAAISSALPAAPASALPAATAHAKSPATAAPAHTTPVSSN